jgi:tetratricopeptide (TPR) repeat protein
MPRISLRAYEKQLDELIEQNRIQEAIDHCRYILQTYPKCISTYRMLGKSFLEGKQYDDAADVFKRVLTVFPDDFISHVGMSIVQENANNLDAAIWHMELAFDCQPSNITIQEELKRLFGRRDGTHPAKIRLTRGALVRMYARGELFPQAIAEIKSALAEDQKRIDLQVLLAKMYFLLGDSAESLDLCYQLIQDLPYCYEVNKILVSLLPTSDKAEKLPIYLERLKILNPYEAFVGEKYPSETEVPDDLVMLDQMESIAPTTSETETSVWVKALDNKWEEPTHSDSLDWVPQPPKVENKSESAPEINIPTVEIPAFPPEETEPKNNTKIPESDGALPDWMSEAGWLPAREENKAESTNAFQSKEEEPIASQPSEDIPDWLRSLAPEETETPKENESVFTGPAEEAPSSNLFTAEEVEKTNSGAVENTAESIEDLPDWLKNFETEGTPASNEKEDIPDWMKSIQQNEKEESSAPEITETPISDQPAAESVINNSETADNVNPNQYTRSLEPASPLSDETNQTLPPVLPPLPEDWKSSILEETKPVETPVENQDSDIPEWIRSVIEKSPAPEEIVPTDQPVTGTEAVENHPVEPLILGETDTSESALSEKSGDDLLSWLRDLKPEETTTPEGAIPAETAETTSVENEAFDDGSPLDRLHDLTKPVTSELKTPESVAAPQEEENIPVSPVISEEEISQESPVEAANIEVPVVELSESTQQPESITPEPVELPQQAQPFETVQETPEDEIDLLSSQTKSDPNNYLVWQQLGDAYAKANDFTNALRSYNKAEDLILNQ